MLENRIIKIIEDVYDTKVVDISKNYIQAHDLLDLPKPNPSQIKYLPVYSVFTNIPKETIDAELEKHQVEFTNRIQKLGREVVVLFK